MSEHPIEGLMKTAMNSIQDMVDVNTIIGEPIETSNNMVIIPISKVCFSFAAGGSEFRGETIDEYKKKDKEEQVQYRLPFGGGSGAGVSINPVAFLVVTSDGVKLMPINHASTVDKLMDYVPDIIEKANKLMNKKMENKDKREEGLESKIQNQKDVKIKTEEKFKPGTRTKEKTINIEYDENNPTEYLEDE
ncbi:MAG: GerW family sporulation protein [Clostridia bacterium]|nr:GerW family sporulation protein [Clostridia bacterium]